MHPDTPVGGRALSEMFGAKRLEGMHERLTSYARDEFGITDMVFSDHIANTRRVIAAAELARDRGVLDAFREAAFDAQWREGKDVEADDTIRAIATKAGLSPDDALAASRDEKYLSRIDDRRREANAVGVTGIPTFVIGDQGLVGAQPYAVMAQFAESCGATRR